MTITTATADNTAAIQMILRDSFATPEEAEIVADLREAGHLSLELVAWEGKQAVGYAAFSPMSLVNQFFCPPMVGLGPMAVLPEFQRKGIGAALIKEGLAQLKEMGCEAVVVLGDPAYYGRFGFQSASTVGLFCEFDAIEGAFQIHHFDNTELLPKGVMRYAPAFDRFKFPPEPSGAQPG